MQLGVVCVDHGRGVVAVLLQFIKKGPATKPAEENKKGRSGLRRSKKRSALSQTIGYNSSPPSCRAVDSPN